MRVTNAIGYSEVRDTIARDWSDYMLNVFPKAQWLFIPNIGHESIDYIHKWDINVLILSGGDDIGLFPDRDQTETELLKYALKMQIPIVAICRGMQLVHAVFGGTMKEGSSEFSKIHRATEHVISIDRENRMVNSYHNNKIVEDTIHSDFRITGKCLTDNSVESFQSERILAMMWHPERDKEYQNWNQELIKNFLQYEY
jgi:putative glutamine amidotransferase